MVLKFQSQTFEVARYCIRRKLAEKDLPQCSATGDPPLPIDWEMSKPLVLPPQEGEPWQLAPPLEEPSEEVEKPREPETLTTDSPKATTGEDAMDDTN